MCLTIIRSNNTTTSIRRAEAESLASKGVTVDIADGVVESRSRVREAPDELGGVGRVVVGVLRHAEGVALA